MALSEHFSKRLQDLRAYGQPSGKALALPRLAAIALDDMFGDVGQLRADKAWRQHVASIQAAAAEPATVPPTLQADLRDYQTDGFRWLCRLATWGVGACLADDMGLGKTVQALALLLARGSLGPALVIAPTSVVPNWQEEALRFAPTLRMKPYQGKDRQALLADLGGRDVVICSYALLQRDARVLSRHQWQTVVFDEAQAIKNRRTKRWQAARGLQGRFRLMTTGTPVENRLDELWSLFQILNPDLLGSFERFSELFATPIEKYRDRGAGERLRRLIRPFVLRRTKTQVLPELPPRTDLVLHVDLSQQEAALYEAIRTAALKRIAAADGDDDKPGRHIQILAELMRLRRACCSPQLVLPDSQARSSKLDALSSLVEDLISNRHRALVYSQFVDHLSLIRAHLDETGISYQYLDGSTPANQRKKRIDAFQAGEGELFLISLRAGGLGINLTAADYVIHMDPWWNPAVEDQASDRAHRIGQLRPLMVYRLVARNTIEEKILALHRRKRELAEDLLRGAEASATMSTDVLLRLIQER